MSHSILRRAATAAVALATAAVAQAGTLTTNGWLFGAGEAVKVAAPSERLRALLDEVPFQATSTPKVLAGSTNTD